MPDDTGNTFAKKVSNHFGLKEDETTIIRNGKIINGAEGWRNLATEYSPKCHDKIVVHFRQRGGGKRARGGNTAGGESNLDKQDLLKEEMDTIKDKLMSITNEPQFQNDDTIRVLTAKVVTAMRMIGDNPQDCMTQFLNTASIDQLERLNMFTQTRNMEVLTTHMAKTIFFHECNEIALRLKTFKAMDDILASVCRYAYKSCFMEENGRIAQMKFAALVAKVLVSSSSAAGAASAAAGAGIAAAGANGQQ